MSVVNPWWRSFEVRLDELHAELEEAKAQRDEALMTLAEIRRMAAAATFAGQANL